MRRLAIVSMALIALVGCTEQPADETEAVIRDITQHSPDNARVVLENDWVKLVEFELKPGESLPRHSGVARVVYSLDDDQVEWTEGTSAPMTKSWQRGTAHWHAATDQEIRNVGDTVARFVVVWRKDDATLPDVVEDVGDDAAAVAPELARVILENEHVRVTEVELAPGARLPAHGGRNRVIYALSDHTILWQEGTGAAEEKSWQFGQVHWHTSGQHAVENVGETTASYVVVAFKT